MNATASTVRETRPTETAAELYARLRGEARRTFRAALELNKGGVEQLEPTEMERRVTELRAVLPDESPADLRAFVLTDRGEG